VQAAQLAEAEEAKREQAAAEQAAAEQAAAEQAAAEQAARQAAAERRMQDERLRAEAAMRARKTAPVSEVMGGRVDTIEKAIAKANSRCAYHITEQLGMEGVPWPRPIA